jgi:hypothetical protein
MADGLLEKGLIEEAFTIYGISNSEKARSLDRISPLENLDKSSTKFQIKNRLH